jgi:hypothetical protein
MLPSSQLPAFYDKAFKWDYINKDISARVVPPGSVIEVYRTQPGEIGTVIGASLTANHPKVGMEIKADELDLKGTIDTLYNGGLTKPISGFWCPIYDPVANVYIADFTPYYPYPFVQYTILYAYNEDTVAHNILAMSIVYLKVKK